jgi:superfamily II DNA or RNA helicase
MPNFSEQYDHIRFPIGDNRSTGLRRSQRGALHAIAAHFTLHDGPAVVVMPTGSGKTAVLMLSAYLLRVQRVLVITPSVFVREQIRQDFETLNTLKSAGALTLEVTAPRVFENKKVVKSLEDWEAFREFDVVVATPNSVSPAKDAISDPPSDLFDLVLIDEAHHSPAMTWNAILEAFKIARCVLFTATPFRRDRREIKGKYIYTYPMQKAYADGVYGEMHFQAVVAEPELSPDVSIAKAAERVLIADRSAGFEHVLMVRADSRPHADRLEKVYADHTALRLQVIHSGHSQRHVSSVVQKLRERGLDGVVCVDMLGEGFDLPQLKVAALHAPHKSLAVTLQFVGRFARVNAPNLGRATILAIPSEFELEAHQIFVQSPAWQQMLLNYGQERINEEQRTRQFNDSLVETLTVEDDDLSDLSTYAFRPLNHVKVFEVHGDVNLDANPVEVGGIAVVRGWLSTEESATVLITRNRTRPKWADTDRLDKIEHDLFVVYHDRATRLLFICATRRDESVYLDLAGVFVTGHAQPLSLNKINRVLRDLRNPELFSVGMRNRAHGTRAEAYRMISGSGVHDAIQKSDGQLYHRGHVFGRAMSPDGMVIIGVSSLSKVWRSDSTQIPALVDWCIELARKIASDAPVVTDSGLDFLDAGQDISAIPDVAVIAVNWNDDVYRNGQVLTYSDLNGVELRRSILDFDLLINRTATGSQAICLDLRGPQDFLAQLKFEVAPFPKLEYLNDAQPHLVIERKGTTLDLVKYLSSRPLRFHFANGSVLEGNQYFEAPSQHDVPFDVEQMQAIDWVTLGVDIQAEYGGNRSPQISIHEWLRNYLLAQDFDVVLYDHGTGECADFLTLKVAVDGEIDIGLYHCKGSGGPSAGDRVDDVYEVCGQAVKSVLWRNRKRLIEKVRDRCNQGSQFLKGDLETFRRLTGAAIHFEFPLEIVIVQPGISRSGLTPKLAGNLAAVDRAISDTGCRKLRLICSS